MAGAASMDSYKLSLFDLRRFAFEPALLRAVAAFGVVGAIVCGAGG